MRLLAENNLKIEAGESSVAGLAGLIESMKDQKIADAMELNKESIVLLFGTERVLQILRFTVLLFLYNFIHF